MIYGSPNQSYADTVIIGSGIAGSTLAYKFSKLGIPFTLLESGSFKKFKYSKRFNQVGQDFGLRTTTHFGVGGTSNLWHGLMAPLDEQDFTNRIINGEDFSWPISRSVLVEFYEEACKFLSDDKYSLGNNDFLITKKSKIGIDQLDSICKTKQYFQPRPAINLHKLLFKITNNSNEYHLITDSVALCINRLGKEKFEIEIGNNKKKYSMNCKKVIICSGAIGSPHLLLNSKIGLPAIGKYLTDHPTGPLITLKLRKPEYKLKYTGQLNKNIFSFLGLKPRLNNSKLNMNLLVRPAFNWDDSFATERLKNSLLCIRDGRWTFKDLWQVISNLSVIRQILNYKIFFRTKLSMFDLLLVCEQTPNPNSCITLSKDKDEWGFNKIDVNWQVDKTDIYEVKQLYDYLNGLQLGYDYSPQLNKSFDWDTRFTSAAHHSGSCRMGKSTKTSVVDSNCQVHDQPNLYVCDASIIPINGCANLGLTISALAFRLADYLYKCDEHD